MNDKVLKVMVIIFIIFIIGGGIYTTLYIRHFRSQELDVVEILKTLEEEEKELSRSIIDETNKALEENQLLKPELEEISEDEYEKLYSIYEERVSNGDNALPPNHYMLELTEEIINNTTANLYNSAYIYDWLNVTEQATNIYLTYDCSTDEDFELLLLDASAVYGFSEMSMQENKNIFNSIYNPVFLAYAFSSFSIDEQKDLVINKGSNVIPTSSIPRFIERGDAGLVTKVQADKYFTNLSSYKGEYVRLDFSGELYDFYFATQKNPTNSRLVRIVALDKNNTTTYNDF